MNGSGLFYVCVQNKDICGLLAEKRGICYDGVGLIYFFVGPGGRGEIFI